MNRKEPNQRPTEGDSGFNAIVGVYLFGIVCCIAGPAAVLTGITGIAGLRAWFNDLHPFVVALFKVVVAAFAIVWITRLRHRRKLARGESVRGDPIDIETEKTFASRY